MRISDLLKLAAKTLKGRWAVLPVAGIIIGMFCLCFAGAALTKVQQEKSMPYELNVTSGVSKLSDSAIAGISKIADVTAATPLLTIPVTIKTGDYSAELTLTGIASGFLNNGFGAGGEFSDGSIMPYIVLNSVACKQFSAEKSNDWAKDENKAPDIDWLNAEFTVILGEGKKPIISKACGILSGEEEQEPLAYISIPCAKDLMQRANRSVNYTAARVRIKSTGYSETVTKGIEALGLAVSNPAQEQQRKWDMETKESIYLLVSGVFSLLCAAILMAALRKLFRLEKKEALQILRWIGMKDRAISGIFITQALILSLIGIFIGIIISVSLPSFLSSNQGELSVFMLPIPFAVIVVSFILTVCICILPFMYSNKKSLK